MDLSGYQQIAQKGQPNGYAGLDGTGKVPASQLPTPSGGGSERAVDWSMYAVTDNGGAFSVWGAMDNQAIYDSVSDTTFISYLGPNEDLWITGIDHGNGRFLAPVKIATANLSIWDSHGVPSMAIDDQGTIHIMWGVHGTVPNYARSTSPRSINGWTTPTMTVGVGTYHSICFEPVSGHLYVLYRAGALHLNQGGTAPNVHEYGRLLRSTNRGTTWTEISVCNLVPYSGEAAKDFY